MNDKYRHTKGIIQDNVIAELLHDPLFRQRKEKNNKGKGSYSRKQNQGGNWEASNKRIRCTFTTVLLAKKDLSPQQGPRLGRLPSTAKSCTVMSSPLRSACCLGN